MDWVHGKRFDVWNWNYVRLKLFQLKKKKTCMKSFTNTMDVKK